MYDEGKHVITITLNCAQYALYALPYFQATRVQGETK